MYTKHCHCPPIWAATFFTIIFCSQSVAAGSVVVSFDFESDPDTFENAPETIVDGLDTDGWSVSKGTLTDFAGNPGRALGARNFSDGNTLVLELRVASGLGLQLDGFAFDHFGSSSGPADWGFMLNGVEIATGNVPSSYEHVAASLSHAYTLDLMRIEISGTGATSNNGTYRFDNFELTGSVTPVPIVPGFLLFGSALGAMPLLRRR